MIFWLTGQPGAGKTTLATWLGAHFGGKATIIDGDDIRAIFDNKDYSEVGRRKNIELAQKIAKFVHHKGGVAIVSLVSPYKEQRDVFKVEMAENLREIYVHTAEVRGRENFHVSNYEAPSEFYVDIDTTNKSEFEAFQELRQKLEL